MNSKKVYDELADLAPTAIISGGASGVDSFAAIYAKTNGLELVEYIPNWKEHGRAAGFIRNNLIVAAADKVIAFWDGKSRGTKHSIGLAMKAGKLLKVVQA